MNRKFVDEFAVEFCMSMNTKANRKKLARALFSVDKNRYMGVCVGGRGRREEEGREKERKTVEWVERRQKRRESRRGGSAGHV